MQVQGDDPSPASCRCERGFDPRPREGATRLGGAAREVHKVSIRAPVKGRPKFSAANVTASTSFDPRPREGATCGHVLLLLLHVVSIHAPVKGRPCKRLSDMVGSWVSIHAPVKGRPPRPQGVDDVHTVSIHAPVKGRPRPGWEMARRIEVSIHAPVKGRPGQRRHSRPCCSRFDPRPREGATERHEGLTAIAPVSIHAPVKGRPDGFVCPLPNFNVSIHAPVKGRPHQRWRGKTPFQGFDPRPREGATVSRSERTFSFSLFRSTPP